MTLTRHWMLVWCVKVPSYQHNIPVNDLVEHEPNTHCACMPRKLLLEDGPHIIAVQYQHIPADGRKQ